VLLFSVHRKPFENVASGHPKKVGWDEMDRESFENE
jgi:hypothetical protein